MRLSLKCLVNVGLALIQGVIVQTERSMQLNDVVNIFLVNDVLNVVNYSVVVILSEAKNLTLRHHPERSEGSHWFLRFAQDKLRLTPQNDITIQPPMVSLAAGRDAGKSKNLLKPSTLTST